MILCFSNRSNWLRPIKVTLKLLFLIALASCDVIATDTPIASLEAPTPQPEPLRPEPQEPHIFVSFSGLVNNALGRIYFRTFSGVTLLTGSHPGNGEMRIVLPEHQGVIYIVTAEAEGYVSNPFSYTIQLNDQIFYIVEDGKVTSNEVLVLKFHFIPFITPTGD
jgi:hypothetical protein